MLEKSILVKSQILRLVVNTFTTDYKYSLKNGQNLPLPIQRQLSEKLNVLPKFFIPIRECTFNLEHLKKTILIAEIVLKLLTLKKFLT